MSHLPPALVDSLRQRVGRLTPIADGRVAIELPLETAPERLLEELRRQGAQLVSLNPMRETLEDFFVESVAHQPGRRSADL